MRRLLLCLAMALLVSAAAWGQGEADQADIAALVQQARTLVQQRDFPAAEQLLRQARERYPQAPEPPSTLGYVFESQGRREEALEQYGEALALEPKLQYALNRVRRIFLEGPFPRWVHFNQLPFSPVSVTRDLCRVKLGGEEQVRQFAYTTSLIFPEQMSGGGAALEVPTPAGGANGPHSLVNRVCYGYVFRPDSDIMDLRMALYYPSTTVSASGADYATLAPQLMHMLLRFSCYLEMYLDRPVPRSSDDLLEVYLLESGPAGAEMWNDSIYLYAADTARTPEEWTRQVAHELGHYALPEIGRFTAPEALSNGALGERLGMEWLAAEAELVTGRRWPDEPAQAALGPLWGVEHFDLTDYLSRNCFADLTYWLKEGPDSAHLGGVGPDTFRYTDGFLLWVNAAHGPQMLRRLLDAVPGAQPGDFVYGYKQLVGEQLESGSLTLSAAGANVPTSRLAAAPLEGATGWRAVNLSPGDTLAFTLYLPAGQWRLGLQASDSSDAQLAFNEQAAAAPGQGLTVRAEAGWHLVRVTLPPNAPSILVNALTVLKATSP